MSGHGEMVNLVCLHRAMPITNLLGESAWSLFQNNKHIEQFEIAVYICVSYLSGGSVGRTAPLTLPWIALGTS